MSTSGLVDERCCMPRVRMQDCGFTLSPHRRNAILVSLGATLLGLFAICAPAAAQNAPRLAPHGGSTEIIRPFNGENLNGWVGDEKYWSVEDGEIVGRNADPVPKSTFLIAQRNFSDFRFTFEFKLVESEMHSGVALWGAYEPEKGHDYRYTGHLVMFPSEYGFWDLNGRNLIHENAEKAKSFGKQHDWNRIEILARGDRIRFALNGELISDWREPEPKRIRAGPIGLQLHSNESPQEIRFRKLLIETFPEDKLATVRAEDIQKPDNEPLVRIVDPGTPGLWTRYPEVVVPDSILAPIRHPRFGLKHFGIREEENASFYAILQKAREIDRSTIHKAAKEFRVQRQIDGLDGRYKDVPSDEFPSFVDVYQEPDFHHGKLVTFHGHVRKLTWVPAGENPYGIKEYWEAWLYDEHAQNNPAVIIALEHDERLKPGDEVVVDHVYATGWFFKNYGFSAQDDIRFAPLLITKKLEHYPPQPAAGLSNQVKAFLAGVAALGCWYSWKMWNRFRAEDRNRTVVRTMVEQGSPAPSFDNIADNDGVMFSASDTQFSPDGQQAERPLMESADPTNDSDPGGGRNDDSNAG